MKAFAFLFFLFFFQSIIFSQNFVCYFEEREPYNYTESSKIIGITVEVMNEIAKRMGFTVSYQSVPWARAYETVKNTPNTVILTISSNNENASDFKYVGPFIKKPVHLYKLKERKDVEATSLRSAKKYIIGGVRGRPYVEHLTKLGFNFLPDNLVVSESINFKKVFSKRIDLIPASEIDIKFFSKKENRNPEDFEKVILIFDFESFYIGFNKNTPNNLISKMNEVMMAIEGDGTLASISRKYLE